MKNLIILLFSLMLLPTAAQAQVKIGDNSENPDPSSVLELESTNKGFLISRLTTAQINAIANPATGLIVYNTDVNLLQVNTGSTTSPQWSNLVISQGENNKGAILVPVGTDADRPTSPVEGMLRYNTQSSKFEVYKNGSWTNL